MTINQRIYYFYNEILKIKQKDFCEIIGVSSSTISQNIREKEPGAETLIKMLTFYPDLSAEWLMRGVGKVLFDNPQNEIPYNEITYTDDLEHSTQFLNESKQPYESMPVSQPLTPTTPPTDAPTTEQLLAQVLKELQELATRVKKLEGK